MTRQKILARIYLFSLYFSFLTSISIAVGPSAATTVRSIPVEHMPTVLLVAKSRSQCEIFSVIHGKILLPFCPRQILMTNLLREHRKHWS